MSKRALVMNVANRGVSERTINRMPRSSPSSKRGEAEDLLSNSSRDEVPPRAPSKRRQAKPVTPEKASLRLPDDAPSTHREAIRRMPEKAMRTMPPDAPINPAEAMFITSKDQEVLASPDLSHPSESLEANGGEVGQADHVYLSSGKLPISPHTINSIRELHRQRQMFHRAEKALTLQLKAYCRRLCDGDKAKGQSLYKSAIDGGSDDLLVIQAQVLFPPFLQARKTLEDNRKQVEKKMEALAKELPGREFIERTPGFAIGSVAALVGECGNLSDYPDHSKLWKRLGLAPFQGKSFSTWRQKGGLSGDQWQAAGYSPARRSVAWNIGASIFKAQSERRDKATGEVTKPAGPYRLLFDARKEIELQRCATKAHANNRALRYMEKKVIRDFYREWCRTSRVERQVAIHP